MTRYQRLNLSRRRGNAIRQSLQTSGLIEAIPLAVRSGQVVLYELTEAGRTVCLDHGIAPPPLPRESLEHRFWVQKAALHFEQQGYDVTREHPIRGNGAIDILAQKPGHRVAVELETGKSDIPANLANSAKGEFDRVILIATSPAAVAACERAMAGAKTAAAGPVELLTWLDIS